MKNSVQQRVCVIGAGIGGVSAAIRLKEKGYDVTIYEREERIGGKCYTKDLEVDGKPLVFDMGAAVVAINYRELLRYARMLREPTSNASPYKLVNANGEIAPLRKTYWPQKFSLRIFSQLLEYAVHVSRFSYRHVSPTGYKHNIPEKYLVSFGQYCRQNQMEDLLAWFDLPLSAWGYGDPEELPVWYVFGEIDFMGLLGLFMSVTFGQSKFVKGLANGYGNLVSRLVEHEKLNVQTNTEVLSITRQVDGVVIETSQAVEKFDYVVISAPKAGKLLSSPSEEESIFLNNLTYSPYSTTLCTVDRKLGAKLMVAPNLKKRMAVRMISAQHEHSPLVICYACIEKETMEAEVKALVEESLKSLGIGLIDIHEVKLWKNYFPHFATYEGYKALLAAQGKNRTIYVGSINKFEFIESSIATSIHLIDRYLPDLKPPKREWFTTLRNAIHMFRNSV